MSFFTVIDKEAKARGLPYLLIGGYAVIAHGFPRLTFDVDLAIERARKSEWLQCAAALGYSVHHDGGAFLQLGSKEHDWPLDFMLLNDSTFAKLSATSVERTIDGVTVRIPSVLHLIALKIHALNHTRTRRFLKDFEDVTELIQRDKIDLASPESGRFSPSMEHPISMKKSGAPATVGNDLFDGVEFPVAPDFESILPPASLETVYHASESLLAAYLAIPGELERRRANGISAEFVI